MNMIPPRESNAPAARFYSTPSRPPAPVMPEKNLPPARESTTNLIYMRRGAMTMGREEMLEKLNALYGRYNRREFVHPDPLEFLYAYKDLGDREIVGLIASSLAYGRVAQILKSVSRALDVMKPSPCSFLKNAREDSIREAFEVFTHRFAKGTQFAGLLLGIKRVIASFGSLQACFLSGMSPGDENVLPAMTLFSTRLTLENNPGHLVALPEKGSACKRMNLFLRWMARKDAVDPGGWKGIPSASLIIPLDTHMHGIGLALGFTKRKQANMRTALEITDAFKRLNPDDPVKYDFALTRLGIREDLNLDDFLASFTHGA